jgi:sialate O-acetylesterase
MKYSPRYLAAGALALWLAGHSVALANVTMPSIFGDHMVLQQDLPVPVWGTADPAEAVTVTLNGQSAKATAGPDGKWRVKLPAMPASATGLTMTVSGKNTLTFQDVLIGEVWVCSGQSNMEFPLQRAHDAATELPDATDPQMRLFHVARNVAHTPAADVTGKWQVCAPDPATSFTAVGYFFGKELRARLKRPVGLIETCVGGTPAQAWTSLDGLKKDPALAHYVDQWNKIDAGYAAAMANYPPLEAAYNKAMEEWNEMHAADYNAMLAKWRTDSSGAIAAHQSPPPRPAPPAPIPPKPVDPTGGQSAPATLYDAMVAPLEPYAIRGTIWYQGEANAGRAEEYRTLFPRMIEDWREKWGEGDFPFLWVQLAGYGGAGTNMWPIVRDAQAETLSLPNTGMATAIDIGLPDNIHPMDKLDVGKRLALVALHVAYGKSLVYSGPMFQTLKKDPKGLRVEYQDVGGGLEIANSPWMRQGNALPMDHLVGFELAGADGQWKPADAKIDGTAVILSGTDVADPVQGRYDWKGYPEGNLYNKEGLPATPFQAKLK